MTAPASPTMGYSAKMGVAKETTFATAVTPTVGIEFISETLTDKHSHIQPDGILGHRGRDSELVVEGEEDVSGTVTLPLKLTILQTFLPWILGGATTANVTAPAETVPSFTMEIDRGAKVFTYSGCKIDKATIRSQRGDQPCMLELEIVGAKVSVGNSGSATSLTIALEQPFMHFNGVFTFGGAARNVEGATVTIDNKLNRDQYRNSQTRQVLPEGDRIVTDEVDTPWTSDETDLLTLALGGGVGGTEVYTNAAGDVLTITFAALQVPQNDPSVQNRESPIALKTNFTARRLAGADEVSVELVPAV